ncbi:GPP34 family phosphoprotein [Kitasatospora nipponensis]|uniref:GPP34 family phosphoprotein n=1 Tax=Kitasatospora nipponensis TaxID=258049 RepID=A0ABP4G7N6_9ACTN
MDLPAALPGRLFLLAFDPARGRLTDRRNLELLLRAAALTDLLQRGLLEDVNGRPTAVGSPPAGLDPVLAGILQQITESRARSWKSWIGARRRTTTAVRDQLAAGGWIRLEERQLLGLFSTVRITEHDGRSRKALAAAVSTALRGPLTRVEPADAALVALADAAQLTAVLPRRTRREHRERISTLATFCGPLPRALRQAITARDTAAATG